MYGCPSTMWFQRSSVSWTLRPSGSVASCIAEILLDAADPSLVRGFPRCPRSAGATPGTGLGDAAAFLAAGVDSEYRKTIGQAIAEARSVAGLTQLALSKALGSSKNAVSNWERGASAPTAESLRDLCRVLRVGPQRLLAIDVGVSTQAGPHAEAADRRAGQLAELRRDAEKAVPDLMQALKEAKQKAQDLAIGTQ